jgi:hypothetical protein
VDDQFLDDLVGGNEIMGIEIDAFAANAPLARALLLLAAGAPAALAQEVFGTLHSEALGTPLPGVLVTVTLAQGDSTIARVTTDAHGRYRVRTGTRPVIVRALRIGQQPVELGRVTVAAGERRELSRALPHLPVQLAAANTRVESRCVQDPVDGSRVAQLFAEARTALWQSRLRADSTPAQSVVQQVVQRFDTRERPTAPPLLLLDTMSTLLPFRSPPVDTLLARGFRTLHADNGMTWSAPDAELLTSDRFLTAYCLRLAADDADDPTLVGVAFEPARTRRDAIQVRGTVWLDRESLELRRITYGYRGVEPALARATPGGVIEYTALPGGIRFVSDWSIRMPIVANVTRIVRDGPILDFVTVSGVQVTRGRVLALVADEALLYASAAVPDAEPSSGAVLVSQLLALRDDVACTPSTAESLGVVTGVLRDRDGQPRPGTLVRARWTETRRSGEVGLQGTTYYDFEREEFTHTDADGRFQLCDLPTQWRLQIEAGPPDALLAEASVRIGRRSGQVSLPLVVRGDAPSPPPR